MRLEKDTESPTYKDVYKAGELKLTVEHGRLKVEEATHKTSENKYRAKKTAIDGITFDSALEAKRWTTLRMLERIGEITDLQRQVEYILIPPLKGKYRNERKVVYRADFTYTDVSTGEKIVEDTKGMKTKDYILKRKLMLFVHGISIKEA